jgi:hypothetical protein
MDNVYGGDGRRRRISTKSEDRRETLIWIGRFDDQVQDCRVIGMKPSDERGKKVSHECEV